MNILTDGKTKRIIDSGQEGIVVLETLDQLTGGDAAKKAEIEGIAVHKTTQTANVFQLLEKHHIPTSFIKQVSDVQLHCYDCEMLPLECVTRRYAWGSFLKREPVFEPVDGKPHRFDTIKYEFFHKHSVVIPPLVSEPLQMSENEARDQYLKDGVWAEGVFTDPYIQTDSQSWKLFSAKNPPEVPLMEIQPVCSNEEIDFMVHKLILPCFEVLEKAWSQIETQDGAVSLVDMKIEIGRRKTDGQLVISDVIDNDSWRIWPGANPKKQLDKQSFRDGDPLGDIANKYALVSQLTQNFVK